MVRKDNFSIECDIKEMRKRMAFEDKMKNLNIKDSSKKLNKTLTLPLFEMPAPISYLLCIFSSNNFYEAFHMIPDVKNL